MPVADLAEEPLLLAEEVRVPEFNQFTVDMCRSAGFTPAVHAGTVESIRAAADLVAQGRCLYCVRSSCISALPGTIWRPLIEPAYCYPRSVLWHKAKGLRPRTRDHHLRASDVAADRLASDRRPCGKLNEPPRRTFVTIRAPPLHPPGAVVPYYGRGTGTLQTATG